MTQPKILVLIGPNLNMLGRRDPETYGEQTLEDIMRQVYERGAELELEIDFRQSNYEGELVTWIQDGLDHVDGIIINAAAYTHTSIAIHDALEIHDVPIVEVHHSQPQERESFRHVSFIEPLADKVITGEKGDGYLTALDYLGNKIEAETA
jgi:3-dehydroquinate dehydratase-2